MGVAYRLVKPVVTFESYVRGIQSIRNSAGIRLTTSPLGITPEEYASDPPIFVGASVPWKVKGRGAKGGGVPASLKAINPKVAAGLENAIKMSKQYAGTYGTQLFNGKLYTNKNVKQWEAGKKRHPL